MLSLVSSFSTSHCNDLWVISLGQSRHLIQMFTKRVHKGLEMSAREPSNTQQLTMETLKESAGTRLNVRKSVEVQIGIGSVIGLPSGRQRQLASTV
uniref:Uncharacterized protein n=1 Tax=Gasterosteus aculeatus TaxID=69293 RepID=G3Q788_GASAC